jgi:hypothetical protein
LVDAMKRALASDELRTRLATAAQRTIEQRYSFAVRMQKVVAVYDALLADENSSPAKR